MIKQFVVGVNSLHLAFCVKHRNFLHLPHLRYNNNKLDMTGALHCLVQYLLKDSKRFLGKVLKILSSLLCSTLPPQISTMLVGPKGDFYSFVPENACFWFWFSFPAPWFGTCNQAEMRWVGGEN